MINLAGGQPDLVDEILRHELRDAGVPAVETDRSKGEVPYSVVGRLGAFEFRRLWYYWAVEGRAPLAVANELYAADTDRVVRAGGCAGGNDPEKETERLGPDGRKAVRAAEWDKFVADCQRFELDYSGHISDTDPSAQPISEFVGAYHIDTAAGLRLFVDTIRKHGLVQP